MRSDSKPWHTHTRRQRQVETGTHAGGRCGDGGDLFGCPAHRLRRQSLGKIGLVIQTHKSGNEGSRNAGPQRAAADTLRLALGDNKMSRQRPQQDNRSSKQHKPLLPGVRQLKPRCRQSYCVGVARRHTRRQWGRAAILLLLLLSAARCLQQHGQQHHGSGGAGHDAHRAARGGGGAVVAGLEALAAAGDVVGHVGLALRDHALLGV